MIGISTEDKYCSNLLEKNKNMEQSDCLNCFPTKPEVSMDWKRWSKKLTTQILCRQCELDHYRIRRTTVGLPVLSVFYQRFQSTKTPYFLFLAKIWSSRAYIYISHHWRIGINWRHNYVINSKECVTNRCTVFKHLWSVFIQLWMLNFLCKLVNLTRSFKRKHKGMLFFLNTV